MCSLDGLAVHGKTVCLNSYNTRHCRRGIASGGSSGAAVRTKRCYKRQRPVFKRATTDSGQTRAFMSVSSYGARAAGFKIVRGISTMMPPSQARTRGMCGGVSEHGHIACNSTGCDSRVLRHAPPSLSSHPLLTLRRASDHIRTNACEPPSHRPCIALRPGPRSSGCSGRGRHACTLYTPSRPDTTTNKQTNRLSMME